MVHAKRGFEIALVVSMVVTSFFIGKVGLQPIQQNIITATKYEPNAQAGDAKTFIHSTQMESSVAKTNETKTSRKMSFFELFQSLSKENDDKTITPERTSRPTIILKSTNATRSNSTLVILLGDLRCGEGAWHSLYKNVLDVNEADLAIWTQTSSQYPHPSLFSRAIHVELVPRYQNWADAIDWLIRKDRRWNISDSWQDTVLTLYPPNKHPLILGGIKGYTSSSAIVYYFRWLVALRAKELGWDRTYSRFLVTRTDQYYACPLRLNNMDMAATWENNTTKTFPEEDYIWVPRGQDFGGITDRFYAIQGGDSLLRSLKVLPVFLESPDHLRNLSNINPEALLKAIWKQNGLLPRVQRFRRNMFTCMSPGDHSNWNRGMKDYVEEGVYLKYPDEYTKIADHCAAQRRMHSRNT